MTDNKPLYIAIAVSLAGGGTIGAGGTSFLNNTDKVLAEKVEKLETSVQKQWQVKANKEYVNLKIQALCR